MGVFPYTPRGEQARIVEDIRSAVSAGKNIVLESGTGTGKTICALSGALDAVLGERKVIYLTRTKSQQKQVITECARISEKVPVVSICMQGRGSSTCPMMCNDPELMHGSPEELSKLCSEFKRKNPGPGSSCSYFDKTEEADIGEFIGILREKHPTAEAFSAICLSRGLCPYEMSKRLLPEADVIAAPYPFIFSYHVRDRFMGWMGAALKDSVIIVDEAHNLPSYLRDQSTCEYSSAALNLAEKEALDRNDPELYAGISVTDVTGVFRECMDAALEEYLKGDDGLLPHSFLRDEMMYRLGMTSKALDTIYKGLVEQGEILAAEKKAMRKLPRSYMGSFGRFLQAWDSCDESTYINLIVGGDNPKFESYCLDPLDAAEPLRACRSSISMSGTLAPLKHYLSELGLEESIERTFPSPFPKEHLRTVYAGDVSTSYEEMNADADMVRKLENYTIELVKAVGRSTAVFFPSYSLMDRFIRDGVPKALGKGIFCEVRGMQQSDLMDAVTGFRTSPGSVLFCVTGGRISEGLDFPDKDLEMAILMGIPYPKPTAKQEALRRYCEYRFGNGWEHAVKIPTVRKMRQAIGRLIRSETDRGFAVILDRRAATLDMLDATHSENICMDAVSFFRFH